MKGKKIIIISIIINILLIGVIYNFIKKDYLNSEKIIIKAMTETEYENNITSLNQSHTNYANYIQESKAQIASAITDMGVTTSNEETLEMMSNNIRSIARDAYSISYDNSSSNLTSTNVQGAVDELNDSLGNLEFNVSEGRPQWREAGADTWNFFSGELEPLLFTNTGGYSGTFTFTPDYTGNCLIMLFSNTSAQNSSGSFSYTTSGCEIVSSKKTNGGNDNQGVAIYIIAKCTKDTEIKITMKRTCDFARQFVGIFKY